MTVIAIPRYATRRRTVAVALTTAVATVAAALSLVTLLDDRGDLGPGEARLVPDGSVELSVAGREFVPVTTGRVIRRGDRVRVVVGGALLELPDSAAAEMRSGSSVTVGGRAGAALALSEGDLLVRVERGRVVVDGGSARAAVSRGAARLRRSASLVVGTYEGEVRLEGAGRALTVPAYRQAAVVGVGTIPDAVRPLGLSDDDEWDRRLLGSVLDLDSRLVAFGRGFDAVAPEEEARAPGFFATLLPDVPAGELTADDVAPRSPGENLIALTLAVLDGSPFRVALREILDFRAQGARWGLVAADRGIAGGDVLGRLNDALSRFSLEVAAPPPETSDGEGAPDGEPGPSGTPATTTTSAPRTTTTTGSGPTTTSPTPTTSPPTTTTTSLLGDLLPFP